tara:strand:- start:5 stop:835 length:831 start_codon:yes stop_codon:yes gene_type:complete
LSGAGKSVVLRALEDFGFYCVDNLPIGILRGFMNFLAGQETNHYDCVAVGIDVRNTGSSIVELPSLLKDLGNSEVTVELIFITATPSALLRRFSETRRKHPLSTQNISLADAITIEEKLLDPVSNSADLRIDSSYLTVHDLRKRVRDNIAAKPADQMALQFVSFGYKKGVPTDADFVYDVRCLRNPYWELPLRDKDGRDQEVIELLDNDPLTSKMVEDISKFLIDWLGCFEKISRSYLTIAFGCTGGRHRSVFIAEKVSKIFKNNNKSTRITHRDL